MKKSFDALRFVHNHNVTCADHNSKHYRNGWVNVECPFCTGNPGEHLGYNLSSGYWNCFRCGWHNVVEVIEHVLGVSNQEARVIAKTYGARPQHRGEDTAAHRPPTLSLPSGTKKMQDPHRYYLKKRGYDPEELEELWHLMGTGIIGPYKFRIIAPIFHQHRLVSYQGRDISNKAPLKYKACRAEDEVVPHQTILYGLDKAQGHSVVVVEGITDVWRLGPGAVATFGIEWTQEQALLLKEYPRVFIMYDFGEVQAEKQAHKLGVTLSGLGVEVEMLMVPNHQGDPAELSDRKAKRLMRQILGL